MAKKDEKEDKPQVTAASLVANPMASWFHIDKLIDEFGLTEREILFIIRKEGLELAKIGESKFVNPGIAANAFYAVMENAKNRRNLKNKKLRDKAAHKKKLVELYDYIVAYSKPVSSVGISDFETYKNFIIKNIDVEYAAAKATKPTELPPLP